ncbi:hypothetical protein SeMB42_g02264 [Synchytrium endobioticum]|uniref:Glucanase n=1 Tax=Synchytrium endobioticum TaxID=286115 RepID=A0A507D877_9FUNG|nr:hypothetical protein SeLEV6574_g02644 [Synchytrium endobioticum]TPX50389.1 hypothetical protein SeMB42_g02264 [Synchytrium endobioticum]
MHLAFALVASLIVAAYGQNSTAKGAATPKLSIEKCTKAGGCKKYDVSVVLDASWGGDANSDLKTGYGVNVQGSAVTQAYVTRRPGYSNNVGSRVYLLYTPNSYAMFPLLNAEFTFDIDVSAVPCGLNAALYFVSMKEDGSGGLQPAGGQKNSAGRGTGYCDAGGSATPCVEMDIWEGNSISTSTTAHPCKGGTCEQCHYNPFREKFTSFYGPGKTVDSTKKITVITQFITSDGTDKGSLTEIKRLYIQNGKIIPNPSSIDDKFCSTPQFGNFKNLGGLKAMDEALRNKMVLSIALWDDPVKHLAWLDGPGAGTCPDGVSQPQSIQAETPNAHAVYENIRYGEIGSTFSGGGASLLAEKTEKTPAEAIAGKATNNGAKPTAKTGAKPTAKTGAKPTAKTGAKPSPKPSPKN